MLFNFNIFGNTLTRRVEKKKKIEGEIEVLKKEQKVHFERAIKNANARKETLNNEIENSILLYQTKIKELQSQKERQNFLNDEELKVTLDQINNEYNRKIITKINQAKNIEHLIEAERKSQEDILIPYQPNTATPKEKTRLFEDIEQKEEKKVETKKINKK